MVSRTRAEIAQVMRRHYPKVKAAAEAALKNAGLHEAVVHSMTFKVDEGQVSDQCVPQCDPDEECRLSSTGEWICVPKGAGD